MKPPTQHSLRRLCNRLKLPRKASRCHAIPARVSRVGVPTHSSTMIHSIDHACLLNRVSGEAHPLYSYTDLRLAEKRSLLQSRRDPCSDTLAFGLSRDTVCPPFDRVFHYKRARLDISFLVDAIPRSRSPAALSIGAGRSSTSDQSFFSSRAFRSAISRSLFPPCQDSLILVLNASTSPLHLPTRSGTYIRG